MYGHSRLNSRKGLTSHLARLTQSRSKSGFRRTLFAGVPVITRRRYINVG